MFNSLKYVKNVEEAGIPRQQAEAQVLFISEVLEMNMATKEDILAMRNDFSVLRSEFSVLRTELAGQRFDLEQKIIQSEQRVTIRLGTIVSLSIGVAVALTKLLT